MQSLEYLRDVIRGLDDARTVPPESWLERDLLPAQERFLSLPHKYRLFSGGIGSGKTFLGTLLSLSSMYPGNDGLIVAPVYRQLSSVVQPMILDFLNEQDCSYTFLKSEEKLVYNGATIYFRSGERPDLFRGLSVAWSYVDEGAMLSEDVWRIILGRLRKGEGRAWICTSPRGFNWLFSTFVESENPEYAYLQSATQENTYLPPEYIQSLERNYSDSFYEQEILGVFASPSGVVYPEFRRDVHCIAPFEVPDSWEKLAAIDFGYIHPFATLWAAFDEDRRMYVYREYKQPQRLLAEHAEVLKEYRDETRYWLSDHDSQDRAELARLGIPTYAADKSVVPGIQSVKARLQVQGDGKPRLFVFKNCQKLIREFSTYSWFESNSVLNTDEKVVKVDDDLLDCLRYLSLFEEKRSKAAASRDILAALPI